MPTIEKRWEPIDWSQAFGALLIDLPKVLDCFPHDFKIAKLHVSGLCMSSLRLIYCYLGNRKQMVNINDTCSACSKTLFEISKRSIHDSPLYNVICDLFFFVSESNIVNFIVDEYFLLTQSRADKSFKWPWEMLEC